MSLLQAIVLSIVQGLTEFLPISSSGHLILVPLFFDWPDQGLAFDAMIHLGTTFAAVIYFRTEVVRILKSIFVKGDKQGRYLGLIILLSMIPAFIVGVLLKEQISTDARSVGIVAFNLFLWGAVLILAELFAQKKLPSISLFKIPWIKGLGIGIAQALALIPGTSRSGITISTGLFVGLSREDAVRFSFLMSIPVIFGAGLFSFIDFLQTPNDSISLWLILVGLVGSFLSGMFAIHFLIKILSKKGLLYFGVYRILLAAFLVFYFL